ncbi:MAG TPA: hypothetical protein VH187_07940 [Scandinavium sp.]|jgi:hypothetical protein|uniref:hypothetical protein n=1 Tax=Scandinavium sp. TaxID=2830653 RepID=UPI002E35A2DD|nr:hypothetical protein [Scandinavium sp.]HEX4501075.1 hypothetical protein [Scandinavium sp.]
MDIVQKLRKLADWFEQHPGVPEPHLNRIDIFAFEKEDFLSAAREMGPASKHSDEEWYNLTTSAEHSGIPVELTIRHRNMCERIETKVLVPEQIIPAKAEEIIPEHEEVRVEWKCPESILSA